MQLVYASEYTEHGLSEDQVRKLGLLGDLLLSAGLNVTAVRDSREIERQHFLDSLSLLRIAGVAAAAHVIDIGSGGGLPALVLALALPEAQITAVESVGKKCAYIAKAAAELSLPNVTVECARAEDYGRSRGRATADIAVSRALASLPVVAEYSVPLLKVGGQMVAMKGLISDQERIQASRALGILGAGSLELVRLEPFEGSLNRYAYIATKLRPTPDEYPRRAGLPAKRPLG